MRESADSEFNLRVRYESLARCWPTCARNSIGLRMLRLLCSLGGANAPLSGRLRRLRRRRRRRGNKTSLGTWRRARRNLLMEKSCDALLCVASGARLAGCRAPREKKRETKAENEKVDRRTDKRLGRREGEAAAQSARFRPPR